MASSNVMNKSAKGPQGSESTRALSKTSHESNPLSPLEWSVDLGTSKFSAGPKMWKNSSNWSADPMAVDDSRVQNYKIKMNTEV